MSEECVSALDVAAYILERRPPVTHMKLQKLLYYCQAWSIVWDQEPLFSDRIEAWSNGPVVPSVYHVLKGHFRVNRDDLPDGDPSRLNPDQRETIDVVLKHYGSKSAQWLSDLTHMESPWREARRGIPAGSPSRNEITLAMLEEYYTSLG